MDRQPNADVALPQPATETRSAAVTPHTPLPWRVTFGRWRDDGPCYGFGIVADGKVPYVASAGLTGPSHALIIAPEYQKICTTGFSAAEVEANAEFIVRAVNNHDELLAALDAVTDIVESNRDYQLNNGYPEEYAWVERARAVIAKAEGRAIAGLPADVRLGSGDTSVSVCDASEPSASADHKNRTSDAYLP